jgi:hypothetical protein
MFKCPKCGQTEHGFAVSGRIPVTWYVETGGDADSYEESEGVGDPWENADSIRCRADSCSHVGTVADFEEAATPSPSPAAKDKEPKAECANCDWTGLIDECNPIDDVIQRVEAGDEFPVGECPKCESLTHYARDPVLVMVNVGGGIIEGLTQFRDLDAAKRAADELAKHSNYEKDDVRVFEVYTGRYVEVYSPKMPGEPTFEADLTAKSTHLPGCSGKHDDQNGCSVTGEM